VKSPTSERQVHKKMIPTSHMLCKVRVIVALPQRKSAQPRKVDVNRRE
jgi:hypothetical protein